MTTKSKYDKRGQGKGRRRCLALFMGFSVCWAYIYSFFRVVCHFSWAPAYVGPIFIVSSELFGTFHRLPSVVGKYYTYYCNL